MERDDSRESSWLLPEGLATAEGYVCVDGAVAVPALDRGRANSDSGTDAVLLGLRAGGQRQKWDKEELLAPEICAVYIYLFAYIFIYLSDPLNRNDREREAKMSTNK